MQRILWLTVLMCSVAASAPTVSAQTPEDAGSTFGMGTLGGLIGDCPHIVVLQVEKVDRKTRSITFKKIKDLKGKEAAGRVRHRLDGLPKADEQSILNWAQPGKVTVCFRQDKQVLNCLGNVWYRAQQLESGDWWGCDMLEDHWSTAYVGSAARLVQHVSAILAGREVVVNARFPGPPWGNPDEYQLPLHRDWLWGQKGQVWRIKASLKILDPYELDSDESPHFVAWGAGGPETVPGLLAALKSEECYARAEAATDLGLILPPARPALARLREALDDPEGRVRVYVAEALARIDPDTPLAMPVFLQGLAAGDAGLRECAVAVLARLGVRAQSAVPALMGVLLHDKQPEIRGLAAYALREIGPGATRPGCQPRDIVPALARALRHDSDPTVRVWAVRALVKFGPDARAALPALSAALDDEDQDVSEQSAYLLGRFGPPAIPALQQAVQRGGIKAQAAARQLRELGPLARPAIPALMGATREEFPYIRLEAVAALLRIEPALGAKTGKTVLPAMLQERGVEDFLMVRTLLILGPAALPVIDALCQAVKIERPQVCCTAAYALRKMGPAAACALPALVEALHHSDPDVRASAASALGGIGARRESEITALLQAANDKEDRVRNSAIEALGATGPRARMALPTLARMFQNKTDPCRRALAVAICRIAAPGKSTDGTADLRRAALGMLLEGLRHKESDERAEAAGALGSLAGQASEVVPALILALKDEAWPVRSSAAAALAEFGDEAQAAVPALEAVLADRHRDVRLAAALALCRIRPGHPRAIAVIVQILEKWPIYLDSCQAALSALGPHARTAVPVLLQAMRTEDWIGHWQARAALQKIDPETLEKVWGWTGLPGRDPIPAPTLSPPQLQASWDDLASHEAPRAYRALWTLALAPSSAVPFLRERLHPVQAVSAAKIARLVAALDSERFMDRQQATVELEKLEQSAEPALRRGLVGKPSLEVRRRVELLLDKLDPDRSADQRRVLRALEVLAEAGTPEAQQVLTRLANGAPGARRTQEAKAALEHLAKRPVTGR